MSKANQKDSVPTYRDRPVTRSRNEIHDNIVGRLIEAFILI